MSLDVDDWIKIDKKFDRVYKAINKTNEILAHMQGVDNGVAATEQKVVQTQTLSLRKIGLFVGIAMGLLMIVDIATNGCY